MHLNVAQVSGHYYGNGGLDGIRAGSADGARRELQRVPRAAAAVPRSPQQLLENAYLNYLDEFLQTGRTPMPCHALRASCFIDPWGVVYPCITYSRPIGRLRDTGMRLEPIWNAAETARRAARDLEGAVPAVLDRLRGVSEHPRQRPGRSRRQPADAPIRGRRRAGGDGACAMNVTCFTDAVIQAHLDRAVAHHVATDVSAVIAAKQEAPSIGDVIDRTRRYAGDDPRRRRAVDRRHRRRRRAAAARSVLADGGRGKGEAHPPGDPAHPHAGHRVPRCRRLARSGGHPAAGRADPRRARPITSSASRLRGGSSELHGGFDEFFRLAGSSFITACINWRFGCRLSDSQNGFRAIRTAVLRAARPAREHDDDRAGDDHQDAAPRVADGRSAQPRAPRACTAPRTSASGASAPRYGYSLVKYLFF